MFATLASLWCGLCNCARGRRLFGLTSSTELSRIISMFGISLAVAGMQITSLMHVARLLIWSWTTLMLWCSPSWDRYWSACFGYNTALTQKGWAPVDWIMARIWPTPSGGHVLRLWGLLAMTLRMSLVVPFFLGLAYIGGSSLYIAAFAFSLLALTYYISGYVIPTSHYIVAAPEWVNGMILFITAYFIMG